LFQHDPEQVEARETGTILASQASPACYTRTAARTTHPDTP
jgi:hypothetical protein